MPLYRPLTGTTGAQIEHTPTGQFPWTAGGDSVAFHSISLNIPSWDVSMTAELPPPSARGADLPPGQGVSAVRRGAATQVRGGRTIKFALFGRRRGKQRFH
jgi:hypothetical protein